MGVSILPISLRFKTAKNKVFKTNLSYICAFSYYQYSCVSKRPKISFLKRIWSKIWSSIWVFPYYQYQCVSKRPKLSFLKRIWSSIWAFPYYQYQCVFWAFWNDNFWQVPKQPLLTRFKTAKKGMFWNGLVAMGFGTVIFWMFWNGLL